MPRLIKKRKKTRQPIKNIIVLYHKDCRDGFGAAWAAWKKFGNLAEYKPTDPQQLPAEEINNKEVYVLDNSINLSDLPRVVTNNKKVVVIDHHKSEEDVVKAAPEHVFDLNHSGAVLSWLYFHSQTTIPKLLTFIEDWDLWRLENKDTPAVTAAIELVGFEFSEWSKFAKELEMKKGYDAIVKRGELLIRYNQKLVEQIAQNAELVEFESIKTLAVNSPILEDELGNGFYEKLPPMGIVWRRKNGKITFSLRSDGSVDVSKLAKQYGGGGHKKAAGFALSADNKLPWKIIKNEYKK